MPMTIRWHEEEEAIIYWAFEDYWTWGEYFDAVNRMVALASASATERFDIICDLTPSKHFPVNILKNVQLGSPKNEEEAKEWGITVVVGGGNVVKILHTLLCRVNKFLAKHYFLADSIEDAYQLIQEHRQQQNSLSP